MVWWQDFFDDYYADLLGQMHKPAELDEAADFIIRELGLGRGDRVFDQCCGFGSMSHTLARKGIGIIGVDQCKSYIRRARQEIKQEYALCEFVVGDAYQFVPAAPCHGAINWRTSFGYSEKDETNKQMLLNAYRSLLTGARFILDTTNADFVFEHFEEKQEKQVLTQRGMLRMLRQSAVDKGRGMFTSYWTYRFPDGSQKTSYGESRIYFPQDLERMLKECGFQDIRFKGNMMGDDLGKESPRCIVSARK